MNNNYVQPVSTRAGRVLVDYQAAYTDPIIMHIGAELQLSGRKDNWRGWIWLGCTNQTGKCGWVPECYLEQRGDTGKALRDYDATELSVTAGEMLVIKLEQSGWLWCTNQHAQNGWVPTEHVEILQQF